mmetsp:Transcript_1395/g.2273  ORF Transcript_1395/g.2273 Transcript_1395/m.2273 type:complete len:93 (-) Transcript_1395:513-791(-)
MAFKAFNWNVQDKLGLHAEEVQSAYRSALFVFGIQLCMITFVAATIFGDSFKIVLAPNVAVLAARFVCSILMHLQVEADVRQGLLMMKYVSN